MLKLFLSFSELEGLEMKDDIQLEGWEPQEMIPFKIFDDVFKNVVHKLKSLEIFDFLSWQYMGAISTLYNLEKLIVCFSFPSEFSTVIGNCARFSTMNDLQLGLVPPIDIFSFQKLVDLFPDLLYLQVAAPFGIYLLDGITLRHQTVKRLKANTTSASLTIDCPMVEEILFARLPKLSLVIQSSKHLRGISFELTEDSSSDLDVEFVEGLAVESLRLDSKIYFNMQKKLIFGCKSSFELLEVSSTNSSLQLTLDEDLKCEFCM